MLLETLKSDTVYFSEQFPGMMANERSYDVHQGFETLYNKYHPDYNCRGHTWISSLGNQRYERRNENESVSYSAG
jgi:hypothetical protein